MALEKQILVNQRMYPLEAIFAAAYVYVDKCYVFLTKEEGQDIGVRLRSKPETTKKEFERISGDFENELLNHALRLKVAKRTEKLRDAIVHRALYSSMPGSAGGGLDLELPAQDGMDYLDDPLGIAVPWEDKFGSETPSGGNKDGGEKA